MLFKFSVRKDIKKDIKKDITTLPATALLSPSAVAAFAERGSSSSERQPEVLTLNQVLCAYNTIVKHLARPRLLPRR